MRHSISRCLILLIMLLVTAAVQAQVTGIVINSKTHEPIDYVNIFYEGNNIGEQTDENGHFVIKEDSILKELTASSMGYKMQKIKLKEYGRNKDITIKLVPDSKTLPGVTVSAKRLRYSRKNNPAVELMQKVIANKKNSDLHARDFFTYTKYEKLTFSLNDVSQEAFDQGILKSLSFLKENIETSPHTGKQILPVTVDETLSEVYYRKNPKSEKTIIKGESNKGITELVNTGEILTTILKDAFTEVDIYQNDCRLLKYPFKSPIADNATSFYRYYLQDTTYIDKEKVVNVGFVPNNQQDIGFSGHLFIMLTPDSTFQIKRVELSIPRQSGVNFAESMFISQDFTELENGDRFVSSNDMTIEMNVADLSFGKLNVQRISRIADVRFDEIPQSTFKRIKGNTLREPDANMQDESFWQSHRQAELSSSEKKMDSSLKQLTRIKGFKYILLGFKAFVENFVETGDSLHPSKVDIGPINTIVSGNNYDGLRFRLSALTTANLSPHWFGNGYVAYGTQTRNVYWRGQLTYSFNKKAYQPKEFPQHYISVYWLDDIVSPFDKFVQTDKDNMFTALRTSKVDQYNHTKELHIDYTREYEIGLKLYTQFTRTRNKAVDALFYQPLDGVGTPVNDPTHWTPSITTSEVKVGVSYEPNATYINTKQNRTKVNREVPVISLSHTIGLKGFLGGQYNYNATEAGIYKRFWISPFGKITMDFKAGVQWNKVPFPLLIHPAANTSYILNDNTFNLISNLEFLNDRYASLFTEWDLNGWLFNRIPLLKKLKWRECVGVNVLWGKLTDKNNPASSNYTDSDLFYFPGHFLADGTYEQNTISMDDRRPYMEWRVGIHNIFKVIELDYVRRLNYLNNSNTHKWGIRMKVRIAF